MPQSLADIAPGNWRNVGAGYNDRTLAEQEKRRQFGISFDQSPFSNEGYESPDDPDVADRLLGEAKASLGRANALSGETDAPSLSRLPASLAALRADQDAHRVATPGEAFHALTEGTDTAAGMTGLASLVPSPASPFLAGTSLALSVPGAARRLISPDEGESRLGGAVETGLLAAPASVRALRSFLPEVRAAAEAPTILRAAEAAQHAQESYIPTPVRQGVEAAYRMGGETVNPNQVLATAREIAAETGDPIETVLKQYTQASRGGLARAGGVKGGKGAADRASLKALSELAHSGESANTPYKQMSRAGAFAGDRTTGSFEASGGLDMIPESYYRDSRMHIAPSSKYSPGQVANDMAEFYGDELPNPIVFPPGRIKR